MQARKPKSGKKRENEAAGAHSTGNGVGGEPRALLGVGVGALGGRLRKGRSKCTEGARCADRGKVSDDWGKGRANPAEGRHEENDIFVEERGRQEYRLGA